MHTIRELKPAMLSALEQGKRDELVELYAAAARYYHSADSRPVEQDGELWRELNDAIEGKWGAAGLAKVKKLAGKKIAGPKQDRVVLEAVARAMKDGRLPSE